MPIRFPRPSSALLTVAALTATALALTINAAWASSAPSTTTTLTSLSTVQSTQSWSQWRIAWNSYLATLRSIGRTYRSAVASAQSTFEAGMMVATNRTERATAREKFDTALEDAIMNRVAQTMAAGSPPTPPPGTPAVASFVAVVKNSTVAFQAAIANAQHAYAQSLSTATSTQQRTAALLTLKTAIDNAVVTRSSILEALSVPRSAPRN